MPVIARADGFVSLTALDAVRDHLKAAKASEALAAVATYDRCTALQRQLMAEGHQAHRRPTQARQAHHALVVADLVAGRYPDDSRLWDDVVSADRDLGLSKARVAAATVAVHRAGTALHAALGRSWPDLLPYVASQRPRRPAGLELLAVGFTWPRLHNPPGVETTSSAPMFHFDRWWPLSFEQLDPRRQRADRVEWEEWCWAELAARRYSAEGNMLTLERQWTPSRYGITSDDGLRQARQPVVAVTSKRVEDYEASLSMRR